MSTIYTRATKGSALTWTEGDANITNLNNDKIEDIVEDTTPQLGGDLDVNGQAIVSASNGNVRIEPNGSGNISLAPATGKIILGALSFPTGTGTNGQVLTTNGSTDMSWTTVSGGISDVVSDTSPQLGGNLDVNGKDITSASNGNINIAPQGTGNIQLVPASGYIQMGGLKFPTGMGTNGQVLTTNGSTDMSWTTVSGGLVDVVDDPGPQLGGNLDVQTYNITTSTVNGNIVLEPNGTGDVQLNTDTVRLGDLNTLAKITTNGSGALDIAPTGNLTLMPGNDFANNPYILVGTGANGSITVVPRGTGVTQLDKIEYYEHIHNLGTTSGTIAPNAANGNIQTITLNGNLTINAFTSPVSGQSITLIINTGGTGRTLTSTMLFSGGLKTLSTTNTTDILTISYIGTTYYASLGKDFK